MLRPNVWTTSTRTQSLEIELFVAWGVAAFESRSEELVKILPISDSKLSINQKSANHSLTVGVQIRASYFMKWKNSHRVNVRTQITPLL